MFADQPDNMVHMEAKGVARILNYNTMRSQDLLDALQTVITQPSLSKIHHDRLLSPRDEAVFWIEFTMRNKEARHLRVQAHSLTWYQYHSLDVVQLLLSAGLLLTLLMVKSCCLVVMCCGRTRSLKNMNSKKSKAQ
ncbi:unnamed protein product [Gadus morhua 'NCC']